MQYAKISPRMGYWSQGGVGLLTDRRFFRSELTVYRCMILGPRAVVEQVMLAFTGRMTVEQEMREWVEAHAIDDPGLCPKVPTQCQRVAGQILSTIATLTGWRPAAAPPRVKPTMRRRIQRALEQGRSVAFVFEPSGPPQTATTPPPAAPPDRKFCYRTVWPGGVFLVPAGTPCPPNSTEDPAKAFRVS